MPDSYEFLKIREKDNPNSLPWDAIPQTAYQPWQGIPTNNLTEIIKKEQFRISSDANLLLLQDNLKWLSKNNDNPINLKIDQFKQMQKQITNTVNQNNTLLKLKNELSVQTLEADKDKFFNNPDKNKGIRYQEWLKLLKQDLQIDASTTIIQELAMQQYNTAKN